VEELPAQTAELPTIPDIGTGGASVHTSKTEGKEAPQAFEAVTITFPPVDPAVAVIESEVEVPVQPPGNVQV
jgi:hypothetical protein